MRESIIFMTFLYSVPSFIVFYSYEQNDCDGWSLEWRCAYNFGIQCSYWECGNGWNAVVSNNNKNPIKILQHWQEYSELKTTKHRISTALLHNHSSYRSGIHIQITKRLKLIKKYKEAIKASAHEKDICLLLSLFIFIVPLTDFHFHFHFILSPSRHSIAIQRLDSSK